MEKSKPDFQLKIGQPTAGHADPKKSLPVRNGLFVIPGRILDKVTDGGKNRPVQKVVATVEHLMDGKPLGMPFAPPQKFQFRKPAKGDKDGRSIWAIVITDGFKLDSGMIRLTVSAFEKGNKAAVATSSVDLHVTAVNSKNANGCEVVPSIDFPEEDGYTIEDEERDYFLTWGASEYPVTSVTLGGYSAIMLEWYPSDDTWWAMFSPGVNPGTGNNVTLRATSTEGIVDRIVHIA